MKDNRESELYNTFVEALINKAKAETVDVKDLNLIKEFLNERQIGANPLTHPQTKELTKVALPFEDEDDVEVNVTPIRANKRK